MFGRNHFVSAVCSPFESLASRKVNRYLLQNVVDDKTGDVVLQEKVIQVDLSVPQTPQSGINVHIGDLSYAISANNELPSGDTSLRLFGSGNPLADFRIMQSIVRDGEEKYSDNNKNDE